MYLFSSRLLKIWFLWSSGENGWRLETCGDGKSRESPAPPYCVPSSVVMSGLRFFLFSEYLCLRSWTLSLVHNSVPLLCQGIYTLNVCFRCWTVSLAWWTRQREPWPFSRSGVSVTVRNCPCGCGDMWREWMWIWRSDLTTWWLTRSDRQRTGSPMSAGGQVKETLTTVFGKFCIVHINKFI